MNVFLVSFSLLCDFTGVFSLFYTFLMGVGLVMDSSWSFSLLRLVNYSKNILSRLIIDYPSTIFP